jgi:hypothetical protein
MENSFMTSQKVTRHYSPRVTLATIGLKIDSLKLFEPVRKKVVILQKSVRHTPSQKLIHQGVCPGRRY